MCTYRHFIILRELTSDVAIDDASLTSSSLTNDNYFILDLRLDFGLEKRLEAILGGEVDCVLKNQRFRPSLRHSYHIDATLELLRSFSNLNDATVKTSNQLRSLRLSEKSDHIPTNFY